MKKKSRFLQTPIEPFTVESGLKAEELATVRTQATNWKPKTLDAAANEVAAPPKGWDPAPTAAAAKPAKPART